MGTLGGLGGELATWVTRSIVPHVMPSPNGRGTLGIGLLLVLGGGSGAVGPAAVAWAHASPPAALPPARPEATPDERRVILFYTAEIHGTVEPCGCTSDPLGDISRLAALLADTRKGGVEVLLLDAGGLLYPEGAISPRERPSADLRASFLARELERIGLTAAGLGETDLAAGAAHLEPKRLASNLSGAPRFIRPPRIETAGGVRVGILGVADPALAGPLGAKAEDQNEAARRDVAALRRSGAELVVLLAPVDKNAARKLAREAGADIVVLGKRVERGMPRPERIGAAFIVSPQDEMQKVGRLEIVLRGPAKPGAPANLTDAGGVQADRLRREEIDHALERISAGLQKWTGPGGVAADGADATFIATKRHEQAELEAERARLVSPWRPPATGNYLISSLVPLRRDLRRDPGTVLDMKKLDKSIAAANLARATPPPKAEPGRASFVGMNRCASCHAAATTFWKHTVHAQAWKTLVEGGKQADYKCIACHTTGFGQVGGSSLGFTKSLESVQCETCHGPGSLHVAGAGNEEPLAIRRETPETVCLGCHTEQHSDTFQYQAYLRDIVGVGHGPKRRAELGAGPTGHELRSTALARAKTLGADASDTAGMGSGPVRAP